MTWFREELWIEEVWCIQYMLLMMESFGFQGCLSLNPKGWKCRRWEIGVRDEKKWVEMSDVCIEIGWRGEVRDEIGKVNWRFGFKMMIRSSSQFKRSLSWFHFPSYHVIRQLHQLDFQTIWYIALELFLICWDISQASRSHPRIQQDDQNHWDAFILA